MSGNCEALQLKEDDVKKILACGSHIGSSQVDFQMEQYVYKRRPDGKIITSYLVLLSSCHPTIIILKINDLHVGLLDVCDYPVTIFYYGKEVVRSLVWCF